MRTWKRTARPSAGASTVFIVTRRLYRGRPGRRRHCRVQIDPAPFQERSPGHQHSLHRSRAEAFTDERPTSSALRRRSGRAISERVHRSATDAPRPGARSPRQGRTERAPARGIPCHSHRPSIDALSRAAMRWSPKTLVDVSAVPTPCTPDRVGDAIVDARELVNRPWRSRRHAASIHPGQVKASPRDIAVRLDRLQQCRWPASAFSDLAVDPAPTPSPCVPCSAIHRLAARQPVRCACSAAAADEPASPSARRADPYRPVRRGQGGQPTGRGGRRGGPRRHPAGPRLDHQPRAQGRRAGDRRERRPACRRLQRPGGGPPAGQRRRPSPLAASPAGQ